MLLFPVIFIIFIAIATTADKDADRKYCENDNDCAAQEVCGCCDEAVSRQHAEDVDCTGTELKCAQACPVEYDIACIDNTCRIINEVYG